MKKLIFSGQLRYAQPENEVQDCKVGPWRLGLQLANYALPPTLPDHSWCQQHTIFVDTVLLHVQPQYCEQSPLEAIYYSNLLGNIHNIQTIVLIYIKYKLVLFCNKPKFPVQFIQCTHIVW